jgi:uncharacterized protein (TIGR02246 family)
MAHATRLFEILGVLSGADMGMTPNAFASWLDAYGRAWTSRDPQAAADLFAEDGTYQVTPFVEPMRGRQAILDYWTHVTQTEQDIHFGYEILSVTPEQGIARWWASFIIVPPGLKTKLDGIFLISLDEDGRCHSLREWWHKQQD